MLLHLFIDRQKHFFQAYEEKILFAEILKPFSLFGQFFYTIINDQKKNFLQKNQKS